MGCDFEGPVWEWWDLEDSGDRWVSKLDMIFCFDGLVGFQPEDWCWLSEQRGCRTFDFYWCMLGSNLWVCRFVSMFNFGWCMLILGFEFWLVYVNLWIWVGLC